MVEVFTIGGGEYIVNTFNAVAAWTGGGGYRALLRVVMVLGLIYALLAVAFTMNVRVAELVPRLEPHLHVLDGADGHGEGH